MSRHYGKYRGTVVNTLDPDRMGKLQVSCPAVLGGSVLSWAMPCVPFAGRGTGFYMLPSVGSDVWVEFEAGNPSRPIWSGCFWPYQGIPTAAPLPTARTLVTDALSLTLDDTPGAAHATIAIDPPAVPVPCRVRCDAAGVEITVGAMSIKVGSAEVNVNQGALKVI